jgi:hypothetical protein
MRRWKKPEEREKNESGRTEEERRTKREITITI